MERMEAGEPPPRGKPVAGVCRHAHAAWRQAALLGKALGNVMPIERGGWDHFRCMSHADKDEAYVMDLTLRNDKGIE